MRASRFLNEGEKIQIRKAIQEAEMNCSGEIRVHISNRCRGDIMDCAAWWFKKLEMHRTAERNGVLFFVSVKDRAFAILGDAGINSLVPENFWDGIKEMMQAEFRQGRFANGIAQGITLAGEQLKKHFPHQSDDKNELTDDISFGRK
ncbi:MAG: TPM domain-containing protein [Bacteroidota bacterium]